MKFVNYLIKICEKMRTKIFKWNFNSNITVDKDEENLILLYENGVNWRYEDKIIVDFFHNKIMKIDIYPIDL